MDATFFKRWVGAGKEGYWMELEGKLVKEWMLKEFLGVFFLRVANEHLNLAVVEREEVWASVETDGC